MNANGPVTAQDLRPLFESVATNTSGNLKDVENALKSLEIQGHDNRTIYGMNESRR